MDELLSALHEYYGSNAKFRDGQAEAIRAVLNGRRTLVIQRTGWGKSMVYFLSTKLLRRKNNKNLTIIISPLLALMNNQIESAKILDMKVVTVNSEMQESEIKETYELLKNDLSVDALIISPERLENESFKSFRRELVKTRNIALFVVDEAHCISDWGHDFRKDYRKIRNLIEIMPRNTAILATTATANDRVIEDIKEQLGTDLELSRGSLMRDSLDIQVIQLSTMEERMAWLVQHLKEDILPGTGIIYCLTRRDCDIVNDWLNQNDIKSEKYYSDVMDISVEAGGLPGEKSNDTKQRIVKETKNRITEAFVKNEIKVLVATTAFGMGFDKKDISFVIHFQKPGNIVAYYQQIGRAGRDIERAYAIMLYEPNNDEINRYFINNAFPKDADLKAVFECIKTEYINGVEHITVNDICNKESMSDAKVRKVVADLKDAELIIARKLDKVCYYPNIEKYSFEELAQRLGELIAGNAQIRKIREKELADMNDFVSTKKCYMSFIAKALDDKTAIDCGHCANCARRALIDTDIDNDLLKMAQKYLNEKSYTINPRKKWADGTQINKDYLIEEGIALSLYGDASWGKLVESGKYHDNYFNDELVDASVAILKKFVKDKDITWVTNISSNKHPLLVPSFAKRVAEKLGLKYKPVLVKIKSEVEKQQKELEDSYQQQANVDKSFVVADDIPTFFSENVLLIDDMVDSRWTFTVCGKKLREKGAGLVYPFALSNTAGRG